ncbi:hypothetical protein [uncultured phage cr130_1]|uniref:Uncharacterized protein n=1 Tax=uncultured phage cr130_1 TaxID=2772092 RepID=A0A7M1RTA6_9CAUD|nr:hypothetical protein KNV59_gp40 [uncultured phage cr130_1]QOR57665.1 hypothetical protein [uncultured phage cr130_1]
MNEIELNAILYYADLLSLKDISIPVTDNCKWFFIHNNPVNSAYILNLEPIYDTNNKYFLQAIDEYYKLKDKFLEDGVKNIVGHICNLDALGCINAEQMLKCIHQYSSRRDRALCFSKYYNWKNNQIYTHKTINDNGDVVEEKCSKYVAHFERSNTKS